MSSYGMSLYEGSGISKHLFQLASFLTIKSGSGEETGRERKDERRDGWKEQEVHGTAERREDVLCTVATGMINKCACGASMSVCLSGNV